MNSSIISRQLHAFRARIDEAVKDLHNLTIEIGHEQLADTLSDLRNRINEPFMFVIVGEVKAGKSSFINALLETQKEICKVSPAPCTDVIQQITYGEREEILTINPYLKKLLYPIPILQEIAIVDTPGTNTIVNHHQEITERFIPASDLIVFVFEAKNPYRQSAWEFFDFIHTDWRKKIIFVLQQKDLLPPADLAINMQGVIDMATQKGIHNPTVFAVSAKDDLEGRTDTSNMPLVREYIANNITGGKAPYLKLQNNTDTANNIIDRIYNGIVTRQKQLDADKIFRSDVSGTLNNQEGRSNHYVSLLVENLLAAYDRITNETETELEEGLSFFPLLKRSFASLFNKESGAKEWLSRLAKDLERDLTNELRAKLDTGVTDLADSIQNMAKMIHLKIQNSQTILKNNHEIFSEIAERRSSVMTDLQQAFATFINNKENFTATDLFPDKQGITPNIAAGSGLAVIGLVLAAVTHGTVFDITGGILTTVGLLFAGVTVGIKRKQVMDGYRTEIAKGRTRMSEELSTQLTRYVSLIKKRIDQNFEQFDSLLAQEDTQLQQLQRRHHKLKTELDTLHNDLKNIL